MDNRNDILGNREGVCFGKDDIPQSVRRMNGKEDWPAGRSAGSCATDGGGGRDMEVRESQIGQIVFYRITLIRFKMRERT